VNIPTRSESSIQKAVVHYARGHLILAIKISTQGAYGNVGYPDYIFCLKMKAPLFIEFKKPGGVLEPHQRARINDMRSKGHKVEICMSVEHGKFIIDQWRANG
jgi:hypothetical protein